MRISPLNSQTGNYQQQNFGHTFRVGICLKKADNSGYEFITPQNNRKLYKELNSKVVGWLNEDFIANLRAILKKPKAAGKILSLEEEQNKKQLVKDLYDIDSDYRHLNLVRSVYRRSGLGYIATGIDVPILENLKGATQIGVAKSDALADFGVARNSYIDNIVRNFRNDSVKYVMDKSQLLYSKAGKEIMLRLNFKTAGKNKRGKDLYELETVDFHEIKKSIPVNFDEIKPAEIQKSKMNAEIKRTIRHQTSQITGLEQDVDLNLILNPPRP